MKKEYVFKRAKIGLVILLIDGLFFAFVSPTGTNSSVVIGGCALLAITFSILLSLFVDLATILTSIKSQTRTRLTFFGALLFTFLLIMQSIGQLSVRDVLVIAVLAGVAYLYWAYMSRGPKDQVA